MHIATEYNIQWRFRNGGWFDKFGVIPGRIEFLIDGEWKQAKSFDEDVAVKFKSNEKNKDT